MGNTTTFTIKGVLDIGDIQNKVKTIQSALSNIKLPDKLKSDFISGFDSLNKSLTELQSKAEKGINSKQEAKSINTTYDQVIRDFERVENIVQKIKAETNGAIDLSNFIKIDESAKNRIEQLSSEIKDLKQQLEDLNVSKVTEVQSALDQIKSKGARGKAEQAVELFNTGQIQEAIKLLDQAISKQRALANNSAFGDQARNTADQNVEALNKMRQAMAEAAQEGEKLQQSISLKETERLNVATAEVERLKNGVVDASNSLHNLSTGVKENGDSFKEVTTNAGQFASELDQVKNRIQYFFGLANAINLVKRAIRSAFNTVKELDKAMTETAVVTDYTIKDMWKQLPEYTKRANQLGVTTKEAYESATLYYQQGLNTEQAAALSTETLKMARIAGLDAAEATDRMTNALRGFNMELNATEAQRVDDVYSQLAAMSASNVDEISTAMTKVASLAHNAGMEFETTSAFLAQIIESTRESAETAGTALKTVVARFSEVKKLYSKEELKGTDEEGQVIDVNKISTALRTAGIDLNKYFLGEVGLDDIFMELASKWDSLTNIQQRYIATQAAGSRQQSRFIALMADYKRTQELVGAAYDSNGASEKQFEKTQDSMQSKLARLKNAWDEFAMGLANNAVLKGVVDALTALLQIINKVTSAFGNGVGSVLKWVTAIGALSGVKKLFASGGFIDKGLGTILKGTQLGKSLFNKGTLSGLLFGGKMVPDSEAAREATAGGNGTTIQTSGGLFNSLFNREAILKRREERANAFGAYTLAKQQIVGLTGQSDTDLQQDTFSKLSLLGKIGTKVNDSKLLGGVSQKLAGTKFASGLSKLLGFGSSDAGAAAAAGLATALGAVAAAAAAAYAAYRLWERFSPEGQLKQATEFSKAMDQAAESAKKAKKETKEVYDTYIKKDKAVEEASTIAGRNQAIQDRNNYVSDLLQKNESYAKYLKNEFKNGQLELTLDKDALKNITADAEKAANETDIGADLARAMKAGKQAEVYRADISRAGVKLEEGTILDRDVEGAKVHRQMTKTELARYTNLENKAQESDVVMKNFAKNAFSKMVDGEALGDELGGLVAGALAEGFDADKYYESVKSQEGGTWFNWMRSRNHWQEQYLKAYGVEADTNMKTADIARAVAQKGAQNLQEKNAETFSNLVNSNKEAYLPLLNTINGVFGEDFTLDIDEEKFIADLEKGIGGEEKFKEFALLMGKTPEELKTILQNNIKAQKEIETNNIKNLAIKGQKAGVSQKFFDNLSGLNAKQIEDILGFSEIAEKSLGEGFSNFLDNLDTTQLGAYKEFFNNFDLDQPLQAVKKLNAAIADDTNPAIQSLAKEIKKTNQPLFDTGYLTQVFMTSEAYEGINENLEKFIKDNGEITAANIEELAESCSDLKTLLTETDVNAQGLARAFTVVGKGEGSIEGITSAVLETLGATESANTAIDNLFKSIDEFSSGRDFGKAIDFANNKIEELRKSLENSDFGNETFKKNYEYFFNDYDKFMSLDWEGRQNYLFNRIEEVSELLSNDALGAMRKLAGIKGSGVTGEANGFDFSWDVQDWTWDEAVGKISEYLDVNEQVASTILAAAAKHIPGLIEQLDLNGFEKDITLFNQKISKEAVVTEQELEILAKAYGKEVSELWDDLQKNAEKNGIELPAYVNWKDKDTGNPLTGDELIDTFNKSISKEKISSIKLSSLIDVKEGDSIYDPDKMLQTLMNDYKMSAAQAKIIANDLAKETGSYFEKIIQVPEQVEKNGQKSWELVDKKVTGKTVEEVEAQVKLEEDKAQWAAYGQAIADAIGNITINTETDEANLASEREKIIKALGGPIPVPVVASPSSNSNGTSSATDNIPDSSSNRAGAAGGYVSYASGSRHIKPGVALTGEEGPELVWNKKDGYAYLVGKNGPEFADLVPGDQVFPADETKDIIRRGVTPSLAKGGKVVPAYSDPGRGRWPTGPGDNKDGDNNKKKDKKEKTEGQNLNLDKYYNMVEDINELLRIRNLLEKDYEQLLKNEGKTGKEIYDNLTRQLDLLEERRKITEDLAEKRKQQILDLVKENEQYSNYAWWNDEDQTIEIDWDAVQEIEDKDTASAVKDYLSKLEDFQGKYDDMIEQLEEIESNVQEIKKRGKEQYDNLEERVRDALIKQIQDKIDELTEVDKAINETNQKLFDSMQETLEKQRQQRENKKTEEDLTDKEKRLAYLQQDSSNANALEIAKLQEELADARQDYTDNLIDQKISKLQKQNDEAQEQRQEQIDLMQRSLDWQEKSGAFWETVYKYISEGTDEIGALIHGSELENLLKSAEPWDKLSEEQRKSWVNELLDQVAQGIAYLELTRQLEDIGTKKGSEVTFTTAGEKLKGELDKNGQVEVEDSSGKKFKGEDIGGGNVRFTDEDGNLVGYGKVDKDGKVEFQTTGQTLTGTVDENGNVVVKNPDGSTVTYKDVFQDYNGTYRTFETEGEAKEPKKQHTSTSSSGSSSSSSGTDGTSPDTEEDELLNEYYYPVNQSTCMLVKVWKKKGEVTSARGHVRETINHGGDYSTVRCKNCGLLLETSYNKYGEEEKKKRGGCFVAGTQILMTDYTTKSIEDVKIGDVVIAYNENINQFESRKVIKSYQHYNTPQVIKITLSNGVTLGITPGHPIFTLEGWKSRDIENSLYEHGVKATWLNIGDMVISYFGEAKVLEINEMTIPNNYITYNIEVETCHTYLADGIVVHNAKTNVVEHYATGGLADFTGPAWLDGTRSHPELVLNARDTQNFIELKDTLAEIRKAGALSLNGGDNYYDIKVQVDSLSSDYDVDRAIDRIKARIAQDGAYRNVNTLSRLR